RDYARCEGPVAGACANCVPAEVTLGPAAYRAAGIARRVPGSRSVMSVAARLTVRAPASSAVEASAIRLRHMRAVAAQCDLILAPSATVSGRFAASGMPMARVERWTLGSGLR